MKFIVDRVFCTKGLSNFMGNGTEEKEVDD